MSFYSILVRLKDTGASRDVAAGGKFLFHTGSIKRREARAALVEAYDVSIPYWFD